MIRTRAQVGHNSGTSVSTDLKAVFAAARPLIEQWLDVGEQIGALREVATERGLDWSQVKALLKAQIQDERDETGDGKRVKRIVEKAEFASAYADMLGLANMNEKKYFAETDHKTNSPDPHLSAAADGQPSIPSSPAAGAKSDEVDASVVGRAAEEAGMHSREGEQAVTHSEDRLEIPTFLQRNRDGSFKEPLQ